MANVVLSNADNVDCLFAGQSLSLFMDTSRAANVVAVCADSTVDDVPIVLSLALQRVEQEDPDEESYRVPPQLPASSRALRVRRTRDDGVGSEAVTFGVEGRELLKVTVDLSSFPERSRQLSTTHPGEGEHVLVDQAWNIHSAYTLRLQLRGVADAVWPVLPSPQWNDMLSSSSFLAPTPRSHHHHRDFSESVHYFGEDSLARPPSTVRSMTSRTTRLFNPSEPRSQLQGPLFVDQTLFPVIRLLFVPALFTKNFSTPPNLVWNMSLQVSVEKSAVRKTRRLVKDRAPKRELRRQGEVVNVHVEESVLINTSDWDEEARTPRELEAIALSFDADFRDWASTGGRHDASVAVDVARAKRLAVEDFTFDVLVSTKKQATVTVEEIMRTVYTYCSDHGDDDGGGVNMLDVDLEDVMNFVYDRYTYMKMTPYLDGMDFHDTVWQAVRLYMLKDVLEDDGFDAEVDDGTLFMDGVLANA